MPFIDRRQAAEWVSGMNDDRPRLHVEEEKSSLLGRERAKTRKRMRKREKSVGVRGESKAWR